MAGRAAEERAELFDHIERAALVLGAMEDCETAMNAAAAVERAVLCVRGGGQITVVGNRESRGGDDTTVIPALPPTMFHGACSGAFAEHTQQETFWTQWLAEIERIAPKQ
jgi:predicted RNA-binding protein with EMAP domain